MRDELVQAIAAIQDGQVERALGLLAHVIKDEPKNDEAWLWLAAISPTETERRECLEFVLQINPDNQEARRGLLKSRVMVREGSPPVPAHVPMLDLSAEVTSTESAGESPLPIEVSPQSPASSVTKPEATSGPVSAEVLLPEPDHHSNSEKAEASTHSKFRKGTRRWDQPFKTEREVIDKFSDYLEELLIISASLEEDLGRDIDSLRYAARQFTTATAETGTSIFLSPSVQGAAAIAEALVTRECYPEAFWTANIFGELCKILLERNRSKYQEYFERLLLVAVSSACSSFPGSVEKPDGESQEEISRLRNQLDHICRFALGTYFQNRSGSYLRNWQPDTALSERIENEALVRHFDRRLRYLLRHNRPRVKTYVTENMPLIYKMRLNESWDESFSDWERLLADAGYDDLLRFLSSSGLLIRADKVGQLSSERWEDVRRAAANNDSKRVRELLKDSADEMKAFLYSEAQALLDYRQPAQPKFPDKSAYDFFNKARHLAEKNDGERLQEAILMMQDAWERDIGNLELRDWVAYLHAKGNNPKAAEPILEQIRKRRDDKYNFVTLWNMAVLAYDRKNEAAAYELLLPLIERDVVDEGLVVVILALSLKLDDRERFLLTVPQTLSLRYHPLAVVVAHDLGDKVREEEFLGQLLRQAQEKWELPPIGERFGAIDVFNQCINKAIVAGQVDQLIAWLEARIALNRGWIPNYVALARVLEEEKQDIAGAFGVLVNRLDRVRSKERDPRRLDEACREILDFCRRTKRKDLGVQAYDLALKAGAPDGLLRSFELFAPVVSPPDVPSEPAVDMPANPEPGSKTVSPIRDPRLAERLAWVTARLSVIRNIALYVHEEQAISEFCRIVSEMNPQESVTIVKIIQDISDVVKIFSTTDSEDHDRRKVLYDRTTAYEKRLGELLGGGALSKSMIDVVTPYYVALRQVVGDLSRQAGVGPNVEVSVENSFLSLESPRSTVVLRLTNLSERPVTDIFIELLVESQYFAILGRRERKVGNLQSRASILLGFSVERSGARMSAEMREIGFSISLRASAEGFPNVDLGITKRRVVLRQFAEAVGLEQIPSLFQSGKPLNPSEPALFHGREDIIGKIGGSFFGGVQRERFFLDGIRRVGKTSILNFLPLHLPPNVFPVFVNLDTFGLRGPTRSSDVLRQICILIREGGKALAGVELGFPEASRFEDGPGQAFSDFLSSVKNALGGRVPLIMIDEFQELLYAIARSGSSRDRDTLVLDQMRGHSDEGSMYVIFTGSVRFERLANIIEHRIFGSITRLRVSFLSEESVGAVLRAGIAMWASIPPETVSRVFKLTGGYPWLVQTYGAGIVDLLNRERRAIATPDDVDGVTAEAVLCNDELFKYWWPTDQLGVEEERFIEWLFRRYPGGGVVSTREFFSSIHNRELPSFRRAFDNLRACEVLDSTQADLLKFSGDVLRQWLQQKVQDGQLKIRVSSAEALQRGEIGIFVDHENLIKSLERISRARGVDVRTDRLAWFSRILAHLVGGAERRMGKVKYKVTVAFWDRPSEAALLPAYFQQGFTPSAPEPVKMQNAVDFKVASEVRRMKEQAMREGSRLERAIVVTGDGDLSHEARALINDGVAVEIWGGSRETSTVYKEIVGADNILFLDDIGGI